MKKKNCQLFIVIYLMQVCGILWHISIAKIKPYLQYRKTNVLNRKMKNVNIMRIDKRQKKRTNTKKKKQK